jgi:hypothetical protein
LFFHLPTTITLFTDRLTVSLYHDVFCTFLVYKKKYQKTHAARKSVKRVIVVGRWKNKKNVK